MSEDAIKSAITTATRLIDELREVMDIYSYQEADVKIVLDAAARSVRLYQENERLKEVLRLAGADTRGICNFCKKRNDCTSRKGSHKYCWQWQHVGSLKELGVEI